MTFTPRAQRTSIAVFMCVVGVLYAYAWLLPDVTIDSEAASILVTARAMATGHGYVVDNLPHPVPQTAFPPLFVAGLALFTRVSMQPLWLKLLPLGCAVGWFILERRLLLKMGASQNAAMLLVGVTAAMPVTIFLSTNMLPETLFAMLATVVLLALLEERAFVGGAVAGLATLTRTGGIGLIAACVLTLAAQRRFRAAAVFAAAAMVIAAPWFGWSLAHLPGGINHTPSDIFTSLAANEKLVVLFRNFVTVLASPLAILAGFNTAYFVAGTLFLLIRSLWIRRQLVPDLFVAFYLMSLLVWTTPPERFVAPVLPLFLWIVWRAFRLMKNREALAAIVLIFLGAPFVADAIRIPSAHISGTFPRELTAADDQRDLNTMSGYIRANTPSDAVLLANFDSAFYLSTGRKTVRGFVPNNLDLYYLNRLSIAPDDLSRSVIRDGVGWVLLTPDRGLAESGGFHKAVQALERGGVIEPVGVPGLARDYQVFKVTAH